MNREELKQILEKVKNGNTSIDDAMTKMEDLPFKDLGFATIDNHRELRNGYPEVIYCSGKTIEQIRKIIQFMLTRNSNILATRATKEMFEAVKDLHPNAKYNEFGRTITIEQQKIEKTDSYIAVVTAGTSDIPIAEEAAITAEIFGNRVEKLFDVGVAGIHRLFDKLEILRNAKVLVVIAGMEGALASVVGGLVDKPIIAVPTSVGYGANFGGVSALLGMLTSCASGVSVVNIDNGFGAGYMAGMINKL